MSILYDYPTLKTEDDETLKEIHSWNDRASEAAAPGTYLVELFPWMMFIPDRYVFHVHLLPTSRSDVSLAKWKRECKQYFEQHSIVLEALLNNVRQEIVCTRARNLYTSILSRRMTV
jgi:hypothetical protein